MNGSGGCDVLEEVRFQFPDGFPFKNPVGSFPISGVSDVVRDLWRHKKTESLAASEMI